ARNRAGLGTRIRSGRTQRTAGNVPDAAPTGPDRGAATAAAGDHAGRAATDRPGRSGAERGNETSCRPARGYTRPPGHRNGEGRSQCGPRRRPRPPGRDDAESRPDPHPGPAPEAASARGSGAVAGRPGPRTSPITAGAAQGAAATVRGGKTT